MQTKLSEMTGESIDRTLTSNCVSWCRFGLLKRTRFTETKKRDHYQPIIDNKRKRSSHHMLKVGLNSTTAKIQNKTQTTGIESK